MRTAPIAIQLYTVRDALAQDFPRVISRLAEIGYVGVETAGFPGTMFSVTPATAGRLLRESGLTVTSVHAPLPLRDRKNEVLETMAALDCRQLICAYLPPDEYGSIAQIRHSCDLLNEAQAVAAAHGLSFGIHNHWWEFEKVEGQYAYQVLLESLDPAIFFQVDTYWVKTAGLDPAAVVRELGARAPLLHIKDGPATKEAPMTAVGTGIMNFQDIVAASAGHAKWLIVELDRCATDMLTAVADSYRYLVKEGLAYGHKG